MKVVSATYGGKDVTNIVNHYLQQCNYKSIYASNSVLGDPNIGQHKILTLTLMSNDITRTYEVKENDVLTLPPIFSNKDRLGIFYSNNVNDDLFPCILQSIDTIKICSEDKADIITNLWHSFGDKNPFIETISWTKTPSHLNQILQILQCLYVAQKINNYRYVSFLEHDVLYPEGYFDYTDFDYDVICNNNYIGLSKNGFQKLVQHDKPLSQITMKFDYAIAHFMSILSNALVTNSGHLDKVKTTVHDWRCNNPCVHVNHGLQFTSHYNVYSQTDIQDHNVYWGDYQQYLSLFI